MSFALDTTSPFPRQQVNADDTRTPWDAWSIAGGLPESGGGGGGGLPIDGLVFHLDGESLGAIASQISVWPALVGPDATEGSATSQPVVVDWGYGGLKAASFDGWNDQLQANVVPATGSAERTLIVVFSNYNNNAGSTGNPYQHLLMYGGVMNFGSYSITPLTAATPDLGNHYWGAVFISNEAPTNAPTIVAMAYDGTTDHLVVNGTEVGTHAVALSTQSSYGITLGSRILGPAECCDVDVASVLAYDRYLSGAELDNAFTYLANRFGISL